MAKIDFLHHRDAAPATHLGTELTVDAADTTALPVGRHLAAGFLTQSVAHANDHQTFALEQVPNSY